MTKDSTANPFIIVTGEGHTARRFVDCKMVAEALAAQWGAEVGESEAGAWGMGRVIVDGRLTVYIRADSRVAGRIEVTTGAPALERKLAQYQRPAFPKASADTSRGIAVIAKDLKRRVVEPAMEPLAILEAKFAERSKAREALEAHAAALREAMPSLSVEVPADDQALTAEVRGKAGMMLLRGTLYATGELSIDHLPSLARPKALAVLNALFAEA